MRDRSGSGLSRAVLFLLLVAKNTYGACPEDLHVHCKCNSSTNSVACDDVPFASALATMKGSSLDRLKLTRCAATPALTAPLTLASLRILEIHDSDVKTVDNKVFAPVAASLEQVNLSHNNLTAFPSFVDLQKLAAINITDIPPGALSGTSLRVLRAENNRIAAMKSPALAEVLGSLELIDLSNNRITVVPSALSNAAKLTYVDLSRNQIKQMPPLSLMNVPRMVELRLGGNGLESMQPMALVNTPKLATLLLADNLLKEMDCTRLAGMDGLERLDLSRNRLQQVKWLGDCVDALKQLQLDGNRIREVPTASKSRPALQVLSMANNSLTRLPTKAFFSLPALASLNLDGNSIREMDDGCFTGLGRLEDLRLRSNALTTVGKGTVGPLAKLALLDLSDNRIADVDATAFDQLPRLRFLDLSGNQLHTLKKGTIGRIKITKLYLNDNPWRCDDALLWLVEWMVAGRVDSSASPSASSASSATSRPRGVVCAAPPEWAGKRLDEMVMGKTDQLLRNAFGLGKGTVGSVSSTSDAASAGMPFLSQLARSLPALRSMTEGVTQSKAEGGSAVEQFTAPLVRFATGGEPQAADIEQMIEALPKFVQSTPSSSTSEGGGSSATMNGGDPLGDLDLMKLPPTILSHVLNGGEIPGIPRETVDVLMKAQMEKMASLAQSVLKGENVSQADLDKYLPPLAKLPTEVIMSSLQGKQLPGLDASGVAALKDYYMKQLPLGVPEGSGSDGSVNGTLDSMLPPSLAPLGDLLKLLPQGYDVAKIPNEIFDSLSRGEIPDVTKLPQDLQDHLKAKSDQAYAMFRAVNSSVTEIAKKLSNGTKKPEITHRATYDIGSITHEVKEEREEEAKASARRQYTWIAVGGVLAFWTLIGILVLGCWWKRRSGEMRMVELRLGTPMMTSSPIAVAVVPTRDASVASADLDSVSLTTPPRGDRDVADADAASPSRSSGATSPRRRTVRRAD